MKTPNYAGDRCTGDTAGRAGGHGNDGGLADAPRRASRERRRGQPDGGHDADMAGNMWQGLERNRGSGDPAEDSAPPDFHGRSGGPGSRSAPDHGPTPLPAPAPRRLPPAPGRCRRVRALRQRMRRNPHLAAGAPLRKALDTLSTATSLRTSRSDRLSRISSSLTPLSACLSPSRQSGSVPHEADHRTRHQRRLPFPAARDLQGIELLGSGLILTDARRYPGPSRPAGSRARQIRVTGRERPGQGHRRRRRRAAGSRRRDPPRRRVCDQAPRDSGPLQQPACPAA